MVWFLRKGNVGEKTTSMILSWGEKGAVRLSEDALHFPTNVVSARHALKSHAMHVINTLLTSSLTELDKRPITNKAQPP